MRTLRLTLTLAVALLTNACAGKPLTRGPASAGRQPLSLSRVAAASDIDWPRDGETWQNRGRISQMIRVSTNLVLGGRRPAPAVPGQVQSTPALMGELQLRAGDTGAVMVELLDDRVEEFDFLATTTSENAFLVTAKKDNDRMVFIGEAVGGPQPRLAVSQVELPAQATFVLARAGVMDAGQHWLLLALRPALKTGEEIVPMCHRLIVGERSKVVAGIDLRRDDAWRSAVEVALSKTGYLVAGSIGPEYDRSNFQGWVIGLDRTGRQQFETIGCGGWTGSCRILGISAAPNGDHLVAGKAYDEPHAGYFFATLNSAGHWTQTTPWQAPDGETPTYCDAQNLTGAPGGPPVFAGVCADPSRGQDSHDMLLYWREATGAVIWSQSWRSSPFVRRWLWDRAGITLLRDVDPESPERRKQRLLIWRVLGVPGSARAPGDW